MEPPVAAATASQGSKQGRIGQLSRTLEELASVVPGLGPQLFSHLIPEATSQIPKAGVSLNLAMEE